MCSGHGSGGDPSPEPVTDVQRLAYLKSIAERQEKALSETREEIRIVRARMIKRTYGIEVGTRVTCRGKVYFVHTMRDFSGGSKPWVRGLLVKKDGSVSTRTTNLFDEWVVVNE